MRLLLLLAVLSFHCRHRQLQAHHVGAALVLRVADSVWRAAGHLMARVCMPCSHSRIRDLALQGAGKATAAEGDGDGGGSSNSNSSCAQQLGRSGAC